MVVHPSLTCILLFGIQCSWGFNSLYCKRKPILSPSPLSRRYNSLLTLKRDVQFYQTYYIQILHLKEKEDEDFVDDFYMGTQSNSLPTSTFGADAVPSGQLPANEYLNLITSPLFNWANEQNGDWGLAFRLGITYLVFYWLICYPISSATFIQEDREIEKTIASNVGAIGVLFILLIRLYSGWGYVGSRLTSKVIEYEKTGW
jgi:hypothetical protein